MTAIFRPWIDQPPRNRVFRLRGMGAVLFVLYAFSTSAFAADTDLMLLTKSDIKKYQTAFKAAKRGQWTLAHQAAQPGHARLPKKLLHWLDMTQRGTTASFA